MGSDLFLPKDDTPGCTKESCGFSEQYEHFSALNATVIGISPDGAGAHQQFIAKYNLNLTLLCDEDKSVLKAYAAWGVKKMYGKEYEGVIRSTYLIDPQGQIAFIWSNVKVDGHVEAVHTQLTKLQKGE